MYLIVLSKILCQDYGTMSSCLFVRRILLGFAQWFTLEWNDAGIGSYLKQKISNVFSAHTIFQWQWHFFDHFRPRSSKSIINIVGKIKSVYLGSKWAQKDFNKLLILLMRQNLLTFLYDFFACFPPSKGYYHKIFPISHIIFMRSLRGDYPAFKLQFWNSVLYYLQKNSTDLETFWR